jgi:hypothetical protein
MATTNERLGRSTAALWTAAMASVLALSACAAEPGDALDAADGDPALLEDTVLAEGELATPGVNVATVGDSWMHNTLGTGSAISGALKRAGLRHDNYAAQGVTLLPPGNLFGRPVTTQIESSVIGRRGTSPYKTVIATGGGNDIILNSALERSCSATSQSAAQFNTCRQKIDQIITKWSELWTKLGNAGVKDVVYVSYSDDAGSAPEANRYSAVKMTDLCERFDGQSTKIRCTYVDGNEYVDSKLDLILDGIHPTQAINNDIAKGILSAMSAGGITR